MYNNDTMLMLMMMIGRHNKVRTEMNVLSVQHYPPNNVRPPLPFGRICFVVLVMRKGGERRGPWHVGCTLDVSFSMCTATRTSSYSPVGPSVLFSLGLHFVCLFCFNLFMCPHPFVFP